MGPINNDGNPFDENDPFGIFSARNGDDWSMNSDHPSYEKLVNVLKAMAYLESYGLIKNSEPVIEAEEAYNLLNNKDEIKPVIEHQETYDLIMNAYYKYKK